MPEAVTVDTIDFTGGPRIAEEVQLAASLTPNLTEKNWAPHYGLLDEPSESRRIAGLLMLRAALGPDYERIVPILDGRLGDNRTALERGVIAHVLVKHEGRRVPPSVVTKARQLLEDILAGDLPPATRHVIEFLETNRK